MTTQYVPGFGFVVRDQSGTTQVLGGYGFLVMDPVPPVVPGGSVRDLTSPLVLPVTAGILEWTFPE